jgi:hypothetical protein
MDFKLLVETATGLRERSIVAEFGGSFDNLTEENYESLFIRVFAAYWMRSCGGYCE